MISCEKASLICNKAQYDEASAWEKFKLKWHLKRCKSCAKYTSENTKLTTMCHNAQLFVLSEEEKRLMKGTIDSTK